MYLRADFAGRQQRMLPTSFLGREHGACNKGRSSGDVASRIVVRGRALAVGRGPADDIAARVVERALQLRRRCRKVHHEPLERSAG